MRYWIGSISLGVLLGAAAVGCGPEVKQSDLGMVVFEVPTVAGADEPYKLPEMAPLPLGHPKRSMRRAEAESVSPPM